MRALQARFLRAVNDQEQRGRGDRELKRKNEEESAQRIKFCTNYFSVKYLIPTSLDGSEAPAWQHRFSLDSDESSPRYLPIMQ